MNKEQLAIRNFAIIAHIDHGKTSLADRLIESAGEVNRKNVSLQLDSLDVERSRGITIKSSVLTLKFKTTEGKSFVANLIDTPGHVDFSYEVERALAATEGAILLVDSTQGIQAQTLANLNMALKLNLKVLPVLTKIDLPNSDELAVIDQMQSKFKFDLADVISISSKTGEGIDKLVTKLESFFPPPKIDNDEFLKALVFDAHYDDFLGVVFLVKIVSGVLTTGANIKLINSKISAKVSKTGIVTIEGYKSKKELIAGEIGFVSCSLKQILPGIVGDTLTEQNDVERCVALSGFKKKVPLVFSSIYPVSTDDYDDLKAALTKLTLNDCSVSVQPESSAALGFGFRCGFFGTLHLEVFMQRLDSEFNVEALTTMPSIAYEIVLKSGERRVITSPNDMPSSEKIEQVYEPFVDAIILTPSQYVGPVMEFVKLKRAIFNNLVYLNSDTVELTYSFPMSEIMFNFFDDLKATSKGFATFDYVISNSRQTNLDRLDILLGGEKVDAFSTLVNSDDVQKRGRQIVDRLKETIPRQLFDVAIQAAVGSKIVARQTVKALRKDVLAKCYGGDITRKKKLLEKQKRGKKRMRQIGSVEVPKEAFLAVLKMS